MKNNQTPPRDGEAEIRAFYANAITTQVATAIQQDYNAAMSKAFYARAHTHLAIVMIACAWIAVAFSTYLLDRHHVIGPEMALMAIGFAAFGLIYAIFAAFARAPAPANGLAIQLQSLARRIEDNSEAVDRLGDRLAPIEALLPPAVAYDTIPAEDVRGALELLDGVLTGKDDMRLADVRADLQDIRGLLVPLVADAPRGTGQSAEAERTVCGLNADAEPAPPPGRRWLAPDEIIQEDDWYHQNRDGRLASGLPTLLGRQQMRADHLPLDRYSRAVGQQALPT